MLLKLGRVLIASDGSVPFRRGERIHFSYLVAQRQVGETLPVTFWRNGAEHTCEMKLRAPQYLVPENRYEVKPTFIVYGGLLFVPLSRDYLRTWGSEWASSAPPKLITIYENAIRTRGRRDVVILQNVMADRVNQGYHGLESQVVTTVQGKRIRGMRQLARILDRTRQKYVCFELDDGRRIVLDRVAVKKGQTRILESFGVPRDRSEDLLPPKKKPAGPA